MDQMNKANWINSSKHDQFSAIHMLSTSVPSFGPPILLIIADSGKYWREGLKSTGASATSSPINYQTRGRP
jgi:hypothetical protein